MSETKEVVCTVCAGAKEVWGWDDMGTEVVETCKACMGKGTRTIIVRRDPVLFRIVYP